MVLLYFHFCKLVLYRLFFHSLGTFLVLKKLNYIINWLSHFLSTLLQYESWYPIRSYCFPLIQFLFHLLYHFSIILISYVIFSLMSLWLFKVRFCSKHFLNILIEYFTHFFCVLIYFLAVGSNLPQFFVWTFYLWTQSGFDLYTIYCTHTLQLHTLSRHSGISTVCWQGIWRGYWGQCYSVLTLYIISLLCMSLVPDWCVDPSPGDVWHLRHQQASPKQTDLAVIPHQRTQEVWLSGGGVGVPPHRGDFARPPHSRTLQSVVCWGWLLQLCLRECGIILIIWVLSWLFEKNFLILKMYTHTHTS